MREKEREQRYPSLILTQNKNRNIHKHYLIKSNRETNTLRTEQQKSIICDPYIKEKKRTSKR